MDLVLLHCLLTVLGCLMNITIKQFVSVTKPFLVIQKAYKWDIYETIS